MNHQQIDQLVNNFVVDTAKGPVDARLQQVVVRLLGDLFKAVEDLDLTPTEVWKGIEYFADAGASHELALLAAGLGLERFLDIRADEADERIGLLGGTPRTIEGPLYVAGAPESTGFARLDDGTESDAGEILYMQGTVFDSHGKPLKDAKVEVWHANLMGNYSFFDKSQPTFNLRRTIFTDDQGRYQFRSIMPKGYGCPPDGTTQALLTKLGRHGQRPAHVHFFVSAPGHRRLTTQINIDGDAYLWDDFAFASREGLVPALVRVSDPAELAKRDLKKPFASIDFDFRLLDDSANASPVAGAVERARIAA
jgi:catechol 1,2-dioxygenase